MDEEPPNRFADDQARQNRSTAGQWDLFSTHRAALEELLRPGGGRLCVLGAGNCNDLDLPYLARIYDEVHLVDIDPLALNQAVHRQRVQGSSKVRVHAPVDLSGVAEALSGWRGLPPSTADVAGTLRIADEAPFPALGPFDVVLSPCLLSQIIDPALRLLGPGHSLRDDLVASMRRRHIRLMSHLLAAGGRGLLAIDLISSGYRPDLTKARREDLPDVMAACLRSGSYFTGLSPSAIASEARKLSQIKDLRYTSPWIWRLGARKCLLVFAGVFQKAR